VLEMNSSHLMFPKCFPEANVVAPQVIYNHPSVACDRSAGEM
jgi:hypothetical protein